MAKKKTPKPKDKKYIPKVGGNYGDENIRFEAGDKKAAEKMPPDILKSYISMGIMREVSEDDK